MRLPVIRVRFLSMKESAETGGKMQLLVIVFHPNLCSCFSGHMTEEVRTPRRSQQVRMASSLRAGSGLIDDGGLQDKMPSRSISLCRAASR
jgi:hypothetical protein